MIVKLFLLLLSAISGISTKCPSSCERLSDVYRCCNHDKIVCCQGSEGMDNCFIEKTAKTVEKVYIIDCRLENLSDEWLVNISQQSLMHLQFENVTIETIASEPFRNLPNLNKLVLADTNVNITTLPAALGSIQGKENVSITLNNIGIKDEHMNDLFDKSITSRIVYLDLGGNEIKTLPLDTLQNWPDLHTASFIDNKITNISFARMNGLRVIELKGNRLANSSIWQNLNGSFPNLTKLSLSNNAIGSMNVIDWQYLPSLKTLDLSENHIQYLNYTALQSLKQLETLDLSRNWLSNTTYDVPIKSLRNITLAANQFSIFVPWFCTKNGTSGFQNLEYLDLSFNHIQHPVVQAWRCLDKLKVLDLRANPIVRIKNNTFANLKNLEELVLANNCMGLKYLDPAAFNNNTKLKRLHLGGTKLIFSENPKMLEMFKNTKNLSVLDLSGNSLGWLNESEVTTLLRPLLKIKHLILRNCNLYSFPNGLLEIFTKLESLSLDNNRFETRDLPGSFKGAVNLQILSLSGNFIRVIQNDSFQGKHMLAYKHLDLSNNPFDCSCDNLWFFDTIRKNRANTNRLNLVSWPEKYKCRTPVNVSGHLLLREWDLVRKCDTLDAMIVAYIAIASFLFVFSVTTGIIYRFRWYFIYWRYKMNRKHDCNKCIEKQPILWKEQTYDACSIYSQKDEALGAFLKGEFVPMMDKLGFNVFIWDHHAGCGPKVSEVGNAMYGSRNAIAIITNSFLTDPWCQFQIEVALDREIELKRDFLTIVVLEEVDFKLLSKFWCVRFTKTPTRQWCRDKNDTKRKALETFIQSRVTETA